MSSHLPSPSHETGQPQMPGGLRGAGGGLGGEGGGEAQSPESRLQTALAQLNKPTSHMPSPSQWVGHEQPEAEVGGGDAIMTTQSPSS